MSKTTSRVDRLREMREAKFTKTPAPKKLPPMQHPEGEPIVGAQIDGDPFPDHPAHDKPVIAERNPKRAGDGTVLTDNDGRPIETVAAKAGKARVNRERDEDALRDVIAASEEVKAKARKGKVQISAWIPEDLAREMKIAVEEDGKKQERWIEMAIRQELKARGA